jgi:hypothetical protein
VNETGACASKVLLERKMVQQACERLYEKRDQEKNPDDGVGLVHHSEVDGHVNARACCHNIQQTSKHLTKSMEEPATLE